MTLVRVALDVPLAKLFDYRADEANASDIGKRVQVPFGARSSVGVILELAHQSQFPAEKIKPVVRIFRDEPALAHDVLDLLHFCSEYYHHPIGATVLNALPTALRRAKPARQTAPARYRLSETGRSADAATLPARAVVKRKLLLALQQSGDLDQRMLAAISARAAAALKEFLAAGWVEEIRGGRARRADVALTAGSPELSPEQQQAVAAVQDSFGRFQPWLLHGVTGSGKTEVYLRLAAHALRLGKQVLMLLPEINLTPQFEARLRERLPNARLANLHSGLSAGERLAGWRQAQSGEADIVLGTRLAIFTPLPRPGLIVVDEEHDASYKQQEGLRYSARDLAVYRAKQHGVPVVLGSATPALESYFKASAGQYRMLTLTHRINAQLPTIRCVNTQHDRPQEGLSSALRDAIADRLLRGEQSLVFINRRGYSPVLMCHSCGWAAPCHRCSSRLVLHLQERRLHCHHCGHQERVPQACPACGNSDLSPLGHGTQRIASALAHFFPAARILRIDRDSTRRKQAWDEMRRQIHADEVDILVGTQILAKGHDFPNLSLVGVLNADHSLYSTDFRAGERLFAQLMQVAGRAGRAQLAGEVLIQTEFPKHPLFLALMRHDYALHASQLLVERKQAGFPPFVHQAVLHAESVQLEAAYHFLEQAARSGRRCNQPVTLFDPVAAPLARRAGKARAQLLVQAESRQRLQHFLHQWYGELTAIAGHKVRWFLDVDPLEF